MTVEEAIAAADAILPGIAAPEGDTDPRWQAVIAVAEFIETDPEAVWSTRFNRLIALATQRSRAND